MKVEDVLASIKFLSSKKGIERQSYFGINGVNNYGLTTPQMRSIAKEIGKNHPLALSLWQTGIHEAKHIAIMIADKEKVTKTLMEKWIKDFDSWDIVDNCCGTLFDRTPFAYKKAIEWTNKKKEFEKRAGFTMMATLAIHDKKAPDKMFEQFFPYLLKHSDDERNFVRKANNWAIRQIGKRNEKLCKKAMALAVKIKAKGDSSSRWIAGDAYRELEGILREGSFRLERSKIKNRTSEI